MTNAKEDGRRYNNGELETCLISQMESNYVFAYKLILGGLCKVRRIKDARKLFDEMICRNIAPNTVTYNTLIDGHCKVGELEEAFGFKERRKELNVECNLLYIYIYGKKIRERHDVHFID